tara:strand:- start:222 stop:407 length:186 start_codon:yes stop_codon:yes gene_type:complete
MTHSHYKGTKQKVTILTIFSIRFNLRKQLNMFLAQIGKLKNIPKRMLNVRIHNTIFVNQNE